MTNLARPQTDWNKLGRELCVFLGPIKDLKDKGRKFNPRRSRIQVVDTKALNDSSYTAVSLWTFSGIKFGTNTDEDGKLWVRIVDESPGAGQATVNVYKASGGSGGNLVATGSAADNGTVTLAAANSSGLTGTVKLGVVSASEANDLHSLWIFPDWGLRMLAVFDGSEVEHVALQDAYRTAMNATLTAFNTASSAWLNAVTTFLLTRAKKFLRSGQTAVLTDGTKQDQGAIVPDYVGLLEDLRKDMVDELTAGAQTVQKNVVTPASPAFDSQNQGLFAMATPTMEEWAAQGLITLVCSDDTLGSEQFTVTQFIDATGATVVAKFVLQINRAYADPLIGIRSMLLTRTLTLTGSSNDFGAASNWTFSGEKDGNTNDGVVYLKVLDGGGGSFIIAGYTSSSYDASTQVFASVAGAAGATVAFSAVNSSGLSGVAKLGSAPTVAHTGSMNLNPARKKNTNGVPDKITVDVAVSSVGEIQQLLGELFDYAINSAASSPTLNDKYLTAGTFIPVSVRDS